MGRRVVVQPGLVVLAALGLSWVLRLPSTVLAGPPSAVRWHTAGLGWLKAYGKAGWHGGPFGLPTPQSANQWPWVAVLSHTIRSAVCLQLGSGAGFSHGYVGR